MTITRKQAIQQAHDAAVVFAERAQEMLQNFPILANNPDYSDDYRFNRRRADLKRAGAELTRTTHKMQHALKGGVAARKEVI